MEKIDWIKDLVLSEQQMEEQGIVNLSAIDPDRQLEEQTLEFLRDIKTSIIEVAAAFNQMKGSVQGTLKVYGISNTIADFMLFRNGYKLIFSMKRSGEIEVYNSIMSTHFITTNDEQEMRASDRDLIQATWGAYGELQWHNKGLPVKLDFLVRHYISRFTKDSAK